jgi:hypothetical protein
MDVDADPDDDAAAPLEITEYGYDLSGSVRSREPVVGIAAGSSVTQRYHNQCWMIGLIRSVWGVYSVGLLPYN